MLALEASASDLLFLCLSLLAGVVLSVPLATVVAVAQAGPSGVARSRRRRRADCRYQGPERRKHAAAWATSPGAACSPAVPNTAVHVTPDASYAAQLRRAVPVVRLYAAAAPGGEKEAAYHALVRLAAAVNAARGGASSGTSPVTPGAIYRDLTQGKQWPVSKASALTFNARTCAELIQRDSTLVLA